MIKHLLPLLIALALTLAARAESSVKISGVHLCCKACVTGVTKAVGKVAGATAACDADEELVTLSGPDVATVQKAADALVAAGYFGKSSDPKVTVKDTSGAKDVKVTTLTVSDVHLCCGKCVTTVEKALGEVSGVASHTAVKNAKSFEVKGDFNAKAVFTALQAVGLTGKAGQ